MKNKCLLFSALGLGLGLTLALLWLLSGSSARLSVAFAASHTVCLAGPPTCDYSTIQAAVDAAGDGDVIKVAAGTYTGVSAREGVTQVVYINKSVAIQGGYTTAFTEPPNPEANPTTLDAQEQGRVLYITGNISTTVEGLRITGGYVKASGGGIYNNDADLALTNTIITNNISDGTNWGDGLGGGVYVRNGSMVLSEVQIISNSASYKGGGMCVWNGNVTLSGGQIIHNTAKGPTGWDGGGGMFVLGSATLSGGQIISNSAHSGGGLYVYLSGVTLSEMQIIDNSAAWAGGGVFSWDGDVTLNGGEIISNSARSGGGVDSGGTFTQTGVSIIAHNFASDKGGGVLTGNGRATLSGGQISNNSASQGGGVYVDQGSVTLNGVQVISNTAGQDGGGILVWQSTANATLTNSVVADNRADGLGSGLYIGGSSSRLLHTTIARNRGGDGSGVHVTGTASTVAMTNTILVSHTVGITVAADNTATLEATLWYGNGADAGGDGTIVTGMVNVYGDPAFVNPAGGDYHIAAVSAAIDAGIDAGVEFDIDGQVRPWPCDGDFDIGADEYGSTLPTPTLTPTSTPTPTSTHTPTPTATPTETPGYEIYLPIVLKNYAP
jgi:hypothetical protein